MASKPKDKSQIEREQFFDRSPYPGHAGEYCGNHNPAWEPYAMQHESQQQAKDRQEKYLSLMRFGKPRKTISYTVGELVQEGFVGLYLLRDAKLCDFEESVLTPTELMEPGFEHLYNIGGKPGRTE